MRLLPLCLALFSVALSSPRPLQAGPSIRSTATYAEAFGETTAEVSLDPARELPRYPPLSPQGSLASWQTRPDIALQLAAYEPLVRDPIAICFDERGRMFVCEMIDYSERRDSTPHLGQISLLVDTTGDGHFDRATVFADNLPWPTGLIYANHQLFVIATPDIWSLRDTTDDGVADSRSVAFTGLGTGLSRLNVQSMANSPQWGQDNRIHILAGGGNRGKLSSPLRPDLPPVELAGNDFSFDPLTLDFALQPGGAQYGMSFDDLGRRFGCSNSDHLQHWVYGPPFSSPNPFSQLPPSRQSIAADGGAAEVFRISPDEPWRIVRTRWRVAGTVPGPVEGGGRVSGYFTGATGTTIYRGDALPPAFSNNSFTGDAGGQLVHRKIIRTAEDGVNLSGVRPQEEAGREFAASTDTWVRVVNFANAPDGCLYLCDMYREVIEHPWSIPDEIKQHLDLDSGNDRGRIYRIAPADPKLAARIGESVSLDQASIPQLVDLLRHPNGWHRDTAHRLLYERQDRSAIPLLIDLFSSDPPTHTALHTLGALEGLDALSPAILIEALAAPDPIVNARALLLSARHFPQLKPATPLVDAMLPHAAAECPRLRFMLALTLASIASDAPAPQVDAALAQLARRDHAHPWIAPALLSATPQSIARALFDPLTTDPSIAREASPFIARLIEIRAASGAAADHAALFQLVSRPPHQTAWLHALDAGLRHSGTSLSQADKDGALTPLFSAAAAIIKDPAAPAPSRLDAIALLQLAPPETSLPALTACLAAGQPEQVQAAALQSLAKISPSTIHQAAIPLWPELNHAARQAALSLMVSREDQIPSLLDAITSGTIAADGLSASQIQSLISHRDAQIAQLATAALADLIPPSREQVLALFADAATLPGDPARGEAHYLQRCMICHRAAGGGFALGPDLTTVKAKGREALLDDILTPHRQVAPQFILFTFTTTSGDTFAGTIGQDDAAGVTLLLPAGQRQTIPRAEIASSSSHGLSTMPEGLEAGMSVEDMADLLAFIEALE